MITTGTKVIYDDKTWIVLDPKFCASFADLRNGVFKMKLQSTGRKKIEAIAAIAQVVEAPPVLTKEQKWEARFRAYLSHIEASPVSYYVAGWIISHKSTFSISYPPGQLDNVIEETMRFGVDFTNQTLSESSDKSAGWSCAVVTDAFDKDLRDRLTADTGVRATDYFFTTGRVSMQARQFVLGFLGGALGFKLGADQDITLVRAKVLANFHQAFDAGLAGTPFNFGPATVVPAGVIAAENVE